LIEIAAAAATVNGLGTSTTYFWRAEALNAGGTNGWSSIWSFATSAAPGAPVLSAPSNGAVNQVTSPTLTWNAVTGAASYNAQLSLVSTFATTVSNQNGLTTGSLP